MKKITNREEANFYYKKINDLVKKYTSIKAKPSEVRYFIQNNLDRVLNREGLSDILEINRIVDDVLDHHNSMEDDGILTFESFTFLDGGKDSSQHQKFLGDLFDCDLDNIVSKKSEINQFEVNSFGENYEVFIYTQEEFDFIRSKLIDKLVVEFGQDKVEIEEIEGISVEPNLNLKVSDFWDESIVRDRFEKEFSNERFVKFLPYMISSYINRKEKINFISSPPDHDFYVYSLGDYDLIFRVSHKIM